MIDTAINFLIDLGKWGGVAFGVVFMAFIITFIVITGVMVLFLIYKQVFFPKERKSESIQYTLFKNLVTPFAMSLINDVTKKANDKVEKKVTEEDSK